jgi:putative nucleotidyltransferase with HDIG domain
LVIWLVVVSWYLAVGDGLLSTPRARFRNFVAAQSFWLFNNPPEEANNITIVAIDEDSRRRLAMKWPWKRGVTAQLIEHIAALSPRVIALDIVFSGNSEEQEDQKLASALQSHPRVVLGYVRSKISGDKPYQKFAEAAASMGFVNKPLEGGAINSMWTYRSDSQKKAELSMDLTILQQYLGLDRKDIRINKKGVLLKDNRFIPSPAGKTPINYLVYHSALRVIPAHLVLENRVQVSDFKDRIVLVGATDPLLHDEFPTMLGTFPGVTILGNSMVMLLSQRFVREVPVPPLVLFSLLLSCLVIVINKELGFLRASLISFFVFGLMYISFVYLRSKDVTLPYFFLLFSVMTAYLAFNVYKYTNLLYVTNRLKNDAIIDPLTGLYSSRFFLLQLNEKIKTKRSLIFIGLRMGDYERLSVKLSFEQIKQWMRHWGKLLKKEVQKTFNTASVAWLTTDTMGIVIEGEKTEKAEGFLQGLMEKARQVTWAPMDQDSDNSLKACLIYKPAENTGKRFDVVGQMENLFRYGKNGKVVAEAFKEVGDSKGREADSMDMLDFLAYAWEEKNKDLERNLKELFERNKKLDRLNWGTLTALARAIDAKSPWTAGHSERVTALALEIGRHLKLMQDELDLLHRAGLLHDIGKIATPPEILDKPGKLTDEERRIICQHPEKGARILEPVEDFAAVVPIAMQHHERFDGKGYPAGLAGEKITLGARILAVADVFDAVTSERPYRKGMPLERAIEIIKEGCGTQFDPKVVEAFLEIMIQNRNHGKPELFSMSSLRAEHQGSLATLRFQARG